MIHRLVHKVFSGTLDRLFLLNESLEQLYTTSLWTSAFCTTAPFSYGNEHSGIVWEWFVFPACLVTNR